MLCLSERKISALIFQSLNISMTVKNQYLLGSFFLKFFFKYRNIKHSKHVTNVYSSSPSNGKRT